MLCAQAEFPQRVSVGAVEQDKERNESCIDSTLPSFANVRVVAIPHTASKGPTYGRYLAGTVFRGETFYMQLDSHTQLAPKWDSKLIDMLDTCDSPKPVRRQCIIGYLNHSQQVLAKVKRGMGASIQMTPACRPVGRWHDGREPFTLNPCMLGAKADHPPAGPA